jgi:glycosyltransferase involved in cell wall biosynthesis
MQPELEAQHESPSSPSSLPSSTGRRKPLVSVALATYNGETFLTEFLASLNRQSWSNLEIVVSDDCSSDGTSALLQAYRGAVPLTIVDTLERVGIVRNFERAMIACSGDYIALADQDDVWDGEKITGLMNRLQAVEAKLAEGVPLLVFSDVEIVNDVLERMSPSYFSFARKSHDARHVRDFLLGNHIPGCAMLFNRALLDLSMPMPVDFAMHDWWLALVAAAFGEILYVDEPYVKYRQHANNAVGASAARRGTVLQRAVARVMAVRRARDGAHAVRVSTNIRCFIDRFNGRIPQATRRDLQMFERAVGNTVSSLRFIRSTETGEKWYQAARLLRGMRSVSSGLEQIAA